MSVEIVSTLEDRECCFHIRKAVFVDEQGVPLSLEMDSLDSAATHFLLRRETDCEPIGTARLLDSHGSAKIGRVAIIISERGRGYGKALMAAVLKSARKLGYMQAILDSQVSVIGFYQQLGFSAVGEVFQEAGIPHRRMLIDLVPTQRVTLALEEE